MISQVAKLHGDEHVNSPYRVHVHGVPDDLASHAQAPCLAGGGTPAKLARRSSDALGLSGDGETHGREKFRNAEPSVVQLRK